MESWRRTWERVAVHEAGSAQRKTTRAAPGGQRQVVTEKAPHLHATTQDADGDPRSESPSAGWSAGLPTDTETPETRGLREQINQLNADNNRLRLELSAIDRRAVLQEPHLADVVDARVAHSPTARRRELGVLLRALRVERGLTVEQVAEHLMCSPSKINRMEASFQSGTLRDIRDLCGLYEVADGAQRNHLMELAREGRQQGWWQSNNPMSRVGFRRLLGLKPALTLSRSSNARSCLAFCRRSTTRAPCTKLSSKSLAMKRSSS